MVAEDRDLSVSSVVRQHLGCYVVIRLSHVVQTLLQGEGGVECPGLENEFGNFVKILYV